MSDRLKELSEIGVSIWLDDLDRSRLTSGGLAAMIEHDHVVGVTTNPSIFSKAISTGAEAYAIQVSSLAAGQADACRPKWNGKWRPTRSSGAGFAGATCGSGPAAPRDRIWVLSPIRGANIRNPVSASTKSCGEPRLPPANA